jgi:hypothetical protein
VDAARETKQDKEPFEAGACLDKTLYSNETRGMMAPPALVRRVGFAGDCSLARGNEADYTSRAGVFVLSII